MLQENRSFDSYFGMLNPYRKSNGWNIGDDGKEYDVDGIDDKLNTITNQDDQGVSFGLFKLASTCIDDDTAAWEESFGDVNRYDFSSTRKILMDGFVHTAEGYALYGAKNGAPSGSFTDLVGRRAMGYYDQDFLNYYYYMASQFAVSDRWFSPVASKSAPNRIATMTGGTTQGLVRDPFNDDHFPDMNVPTIFSRLDDAGVSWTVYYSETQGGCLTGSTSDDCSPKNGSYFPATTYTDFTGFSKYIYANPTHAVCTGTTQGSMVVGDPTNSFCIDPHHIAPLSQYFADAQNGTLPSFAFIEAAYGHNDEHPGYQQSILKGQQQIAEIVSALMHGPSWTDSAFFLSYDEAGGPYDHVPPVPLHTNDNTDPALGVATDISSIAVNPDGYFPCLANGTIHCDLQTGEPGTSPADAAAKYGFAAQLGFRVPNLIISPFTRKHYVSHTPMDHTAVLKLVEDRFLGNKRYLTARDAAQPDLSEFFDFTNIPWKTPPSPPAARPLSQDACYPDAMGP